MVGRGSIRKGIICIGMRRKFIQILFVNIILLMFFVNIVLSDSNNADPSTTLSQLRILDSEEKKEDTSSRGASSSGGSQDDEQARDLIGNGRGSYVDSDNKVHYMSGGKEVTKRQYEVESRLDNYDSAMEAFNDAKKDAGWWTTEEEQEAIDSAQDWLDEARDSLAGIEYGIEDYPEAASIYYSAMSDPDRYVSEAFGLKAIAPDGTELWGWEVPDYQQAARDKMWDAQAKTAIKNDISIASDIDIKIEDAIRQRQEEIESEDGESEATLSAEEKQRIKDRIMKEEAEKIRKSYQDQSDKKMARQIADAYIRQAVSKLLNQLLGEYAYDKIADICKEEYESSQPVSSMPMQTSSGQDDGLSTGSYDLESGLYCQNSHETVLTAQGKKIREEGLYRFELSWSITACNKNLQYSVYVADGSAERETVSSGNLPAGQTKSDTETYTSSKDYSDVCMQVSDLSIADNGYACFPLIDDYDESSPIISSFTIDKQNPEEGDSVKFTAICNDDVGIKIMYLADNSTGELRNKTSKEGNNAKTLEFESVLEGRRAGEVISSKFSCLDTSGNYAESQIRIITFVNKTTSQMMNETDTLTETNAPNILSAVINESSPYVGEDVRFSVQCNDDTEIRTVYFADNRTGVWANASSKEVNAQDIFYTVDHTKVSPIYSVVGGKFTCVDPYGNSVQSAVLSYSVD